MAKKLFRAIIENAFEVLIIGAAFLLAGFFLWIFSLYLLG